ncbi:TPA: hypothetical protein OVL37_002454 [Staphylococcus aureus]|uniref:hypothetical protein n=1 Tax=Staphylococcus epidermidis TaxID=1282 RepID=UPI00024E20CF|nr:hypothetical protein [Staphylococcus epidermidis]MBG3415865.1 hypothetical protein [Staphylococcus aureus]EHR84402.1 hypothetical protein SEVCU120_2059 [Staphylococcus epidermidis VCU120]MCG2134979.1 hypothetical protein [Staphylococcus epidermidis]MDU5113593.1 hypothetical protein [Staphylococcus epidermidis]HCV0270573.1 hypothetical protein [Staphylococcus aureus]
MRYLFLFFIGVLMICLIFPAMEGIFDDVLSDMDDNGPAKRMIRETREVKGTVINSEDQSYKKEKSTFLLTGGGEEVVEKYIIKIKENDGSIMSVKANEDQFLRYNKGNNIKVVVDKESNEIKYDMRSDKDKEEYTEYKKLAHTKKEK